MTSFFKNEVIANLREKKQELEGKIEAIKTLINTDAVKEWKVTKDDDEYIQEILFSIKNILGIEDGA